MHVLGYSTLPTTTTYTIQEQVHGSGKCLGVVTPGRLSFTLTTKLPKVLR